MNWENDEMFKTFEITEEKTLTIQDLLRNIYEYFSDMEEYLIEYNEMCEDDYNYDYTQISKDYRENRIDRNSSDKYIRIILKYKYNFIKDFSILCYSDTLLDISKRMKFISYPVYYYIDINDYRDQRLVECLYMLSVYLEKLVKHYIIDLNEFYDTILGVIFVNDDNSLYNSTDLRENIFIITEYLFDI